MYKRRDQDHTQEKEIQKGKIADKRREAKGKGKKERYTHLSICAAEVNR